MWRVSSSHYPPKPRGTRRGWSGVRQHENRQDSVIKSPAPPYGPLLVEISNTKLERSEECPQITDCEDVSSYTWLGQAAPSILIPVMEVNLQGGPPIWTPGTEDRQLEPDRGEYFRDPNAARYPSYPWQAAFEAISRESPDYDLANTDIVACSSTLGNLTRFARGVDKDYRFIMELVGDSVFFVRRENSPTDLIPDVRGYGHTFLDQYKTWGPGLAGSESHQRIIKYTFRGLHLLVRFESDGYIPKDPQESLSSNQETGRSSSSGDGDTNIDSLVARLEGDHGRDPVDDSGRLKIHESGRQIGQSDIINIKTRSMVDFKTGAIKKEIDMTDLTPRLWVSQIPTLIVAYHNRGLFDDIRVQDMRDEITRWEQENDKMLRRVASLLHELMHYAKSSKTRLEVCRSGAGPIQIRRVTGDSPMALAPETKAKWRGRDSPDGSNHTCILSRDNNYSTQLIESDNSDPESGYDARD
ncbi:geranylgeranyl pyrophosphate synthetase [Aspergillus vadensis CBS 113365]|uniref:Geranylgeranyl pyrophosphate synthetase n=1 Tax=Aspergillus vadensis (strain CBS 113365 / IMI 142717 / IBT 24658) TaxID=1448311 RepID=A0A319AX71_ASPVC|nr:geranylgeranyl pyrophosphate synthetase [Aspergillus vadensis CBS 113365]PYH63991.1 geranylgeranyl pyrophosphate synthetase [Aspergillus vadensis CBS 113365]